jgi:hypothetical protein
MWLPPRRRFPFNLTAKVPLPDYAVTLLLTTVVTVCIAVPVYWFCSWVLGLFEARLADGWPLKVAAGVVSLLFQFILARIFDHVDYWTSPRKGNRRHF